ncbi:MAG TPA: efflux transporter outer membrane subunit [Rubrivivax sp.]|nr:efflux transporter outer membrane subunit [Rubrivivax sp.]
MNTRLPVISLLASAALCGVACTTVGPDYATPPLAGDAPAAYAERHAGSPLLAAPPAADAAALPADPWGALGGDTLKALQQRARERNADIATAALHLAQARTQRDVAASQAGPTLGISGSAARQRQSQTDAATRVFEIFPPASQQQALDIIGAPYTLYQAGFDASWELDLWGRVRRSIEAAEADDAAAAALLADVRSSIDAEVARAWLDLGAARQQLAVLQRQQASAAELLALLEARQRHGLVDASAALRQRSVLDDLAARVPPLLETEAGAWRRIELLCGDMPGSLAAQLGAPVGNSVGGTAAATPWPALALGLPSTLAARRPDIAAAAAQLHAATATVGIAFADLYPRVMLGAGYGSASVGSSNFATWPSQQWWFGASVDLPLFDGGRRRAAVTQRELQMQQAAVAFRQTVVSAWHDVDAAVARYEAERRRSAELQRKLAASDEAFQLARVRYERGLSDETPLLETERTRLDAEREAIVSHAQQGLALVAVYKALRVEGG